MKVDDGWMYLSEDRELRTLCDSRSGQREVCSALSSSTNGWAQQQQEQAVTPDQAEERAFERKRGRRGPDSTNSNERQRQLRGAHTALLWVGVWSSSHCHRHVGGQHIGGRNVQTEHFRTLCSQGNTTLVHRVQNCVVNCAST